MTKNCSVQNVNSSEKPCFRGCQFLLWIFILLLFSWVFTVRYQNSTISPISDRLESWTAIDRSNYREPLYSSVFLPMIPHRVLKWYLRPGEPQEPRWALSGFCQMGGLSGLPCAFWHDTEVGVSVLRSSQQAQAGVGLCSAIPNPDLEYNFKKKRILTLKSLLTCLKVGLWLLVLIFSINTMSLLDFSSFCKAVLLYVVKIPHNKLCDLISASHSLACGVLKTAVLGEGLLFIGLCLDFLGLQVGEWLKEDLELTAKTTQLQKCQNMCPSAWVPGTHLRPNPALSAP